MGESRTNWIVVNTQFQQTIPYVVKRTRIMLQDKTIDLDDLTEWEDEALFRLENLPSRPYEKDYDAMMDITVEMDLDLNILARENYTVLDLLSDIGGIQGILMSGFAMVLGVFNYGHFSTYMASRLFKIKKEDADEAGKYEYSF